MLLFSELTILNALWVSTNDLRKLDIIYERSRRGLGQPDTLVPLYHIARKIDNNQAFVDLLHSYLLQDTYH